jgi:hypothetical protein
MPKTYEPIQTTTLTGNQTTVTLTSIPGTYTDLVLVINAKNDTLTNSEIRFNSDSTTNYSMTALFGDGSTAQSVIETSTAQASIDYISYLYTTDFAYSNVIQIMNYSNTTTYKTFLARANSAASGVDLIAGLWRQTAAITSLSILTTTGTRNFASGSTFTLYGIKAA